MITIVMPTQAHAYRGREWSKGEEHDVEYRDYQSLKAAGVPISIVKKNPPPTPTPAEVRRTEIAERAGPPIVTKTSGENRAERRERTKKHGATPPALPSGPATFPTD